MIDDDLDHPPSPMKYILGHADNVPLEVILCPNQRVPDAEFLVRIQVCHGLREHSILVVHVAQDLREIHSAFNLGSKVVLSPLAAVTAISSLSFDGGISSGSTLLVLLFNSSDSTIQVSFFLTRRFDHLVAAVFSTMYLSVGSSSPSGSSLAYVFT
jgi:hypothetical protein